MIVVFPPLISWITGSTTHCWSSKHSNYQWKQSTKDSVLQKYFLEITATNTRDLSPGFAALSKYFCFPGLLLNKLKHFTYRTREPAHREVGSEQLAHVRAGKCHRARLGGVEEAGTGPLGGQQLSKFRNHDSVLLQGVHRRPRDHTALPAPTSSPRSAPTKTLGHGCPGFESPTATPAQGPHDFRDNACRVTFACVPGERWSNSDLPK